MAHSGSSDEDPYRWETFLLQPKSSGYQKKYLIIIFFADFIFSFSLTPSGSSGSSGKVFGQIVIKKEKLFKFKIFRVCETDLVTIEACEDTPAMAMDLSIGGKRSKYLKAKKA